MIFSCENLRIKIGSNSELWAGSEYVFRFMCFNDVWRENIILMFFSTYVCALWTYNMEILLRDHSYSYINCFCPNPHETLSNGKYTHSRTPFAIWHYCNEQKTSKKSSRNIPSTYHYSPYHIYFCWKCDPLTGILI